MLIVTVKDDELISGLVTCYTFLDTQASASKVATYEFNTFGSSGVITALPLFVLPACTSHFLSCKSK
jgi:hypothetical protein